MKIKAKISFVGEVTMGAGDVKDVSDAAAKDLIAAGYAEAAGTKAKPAKKPEKAEKSEKPAKSAK